jgi:hypothetical protein
MTTVAVVQERLTGIFFPVPGRAMGRPRKRERGKPVNALRMPSRHSSDEFTALHYCG